MAVKAIDRHALVREQIIPLPAGDNPQVHS